MILFLKEKEKKIISIEKKSKKLHIQKVIQVQNEKFWNICCKVGTKV